MKEHVQILTYVPVNIRSRAKTVAKKIRSTVSQIVRDGFVEKVEYYEEKLRAEAEREAEKETSHKKSRDTRKLGMPLDGAPTPPPSTPPGAEPIAVSPIADDLDAIYDAHAAKILDAMEKSPNEKRLRAAEAISAIKHRAPLTHPPEREILAELEVRILRLRAARPASPQLAPEQPKERIVDDLVGKEIDATKIRSRGDVE